TSQDVWAVASRALTSMRLRVALRCVRCPAASLINIASKSRCSRAPPKPSRCFTRADARISSQASGLQCGNPSNAFRHERGEPRYQPNSQRSNRLKRFERFESLERIELL